MDRNIYISPWFLLFCLAFSLRASELSVVLNILVGFNVFFSLLRYVINLVNHTNNQTNVILCFNKNTEEQIKTNSSKHLAFFAVCTVPTRWQCLIRSKKFCCRSSYFYKRSYLHTQLGDDGLFLQKDLLG